MWSVAIAPFYVEWAVELHLIDERDAGRFLHDPPDIDPYAGLSAEERLEAVVRSASSGAPADLPPRTVLINGRHVLFPPNPRKHRGRPRPRTKETT